MSNLLWASCCLPGTVPKWQLDQGAKGTLLSIDSQAEGAVERHLAPLPCGPGDDISPRQGADCKGGRERVDRGPQGWASPGSLGSLIILQTCLKEQPGGGRLSTFPACGRRTYSYFGLLPLTVCMAWNRQAGLPGWLLFQRIHPLVFLHLWGGGLTQLFHFFLVPSADSCLGSVPLSCLPRPLCLVLHTLEIQFDKGNFKKLIL